MKDIPWMGGGDGDPMDDRRRCRATNRNGERCGRAPIRGGVVCSMHGGAIPTVKSAAAARHAAQLAEADAAKAVNLFGGKRDVHPAQALLELVQRKAAEVEYWRARVADLHEQDLTHGVTKVESGIDRDQEKDITTTEAKPNILLVMLRQAEQDLAAYSAASLKAGVDQQLISLAREQGLRIVSVMRAVLADRRLQLGADARTVDLVLLEHVQVEVLG